MAYNRFQVALDIQDAVNMRGIAREFVKVVDDAAEELKDTVKVWRDPAVTLMLDKLRDLNGRPDINQVIDLFRKVETLAAARRDAAAKDAEFKRQSNFAFGDQE